jgi:hypothetical protein
MDSNLGVAPLAPSPETDAAAAALAHLRGMQGDGRLLLSHVAGRADRTLPQPLAAGAPSPVSLLFADAALVAADPLKLEALACCVDQLSRAAAPATAATIRLTRGYLRSGGAEGADVATPELLRRAFLVRLVVRFLAGFGIAAVAIAVLLLAHVDNGRRNLQQLRAVDAELRTTYENLALLPAAAWVAASAERPSFRPLCGKPDDGARQPAESPEGLRANGLCNAAYEGSLRKNIVLQQIANWNCRTARPIAALFGLCSEPLKDTTATQDGAQRATLEHWNRTELRIESTIATLTGFVLPLIMGFIGGCAFVLRRISQKLSEQTLSARDGSQAILRVLLATTLGGLLGVVWTGDPPLPLGGFNLSLAAAAFFVGFALEAVFTLIEAIVESVAGRLRQGAAAPGAPAVPGG